MLELEQKYDVTPEFVLPDLAGLKGVAGVTDPVEQILEATYFDTPDHRLAAAGVSLRRRTGGDDEGWHLKLPSAVEPDARHELRVGLGRAVRTVPKRLRSTVSGLTGSQGLDPVATITTRRTMRRLLDGDGAVLAEVADDTVVARRGGTGPVTWREIEVELVEGRPKVLRKAGRRLAAAGADRTHRQSKIAELLGGAGPGPVAAVRPKDPLRVLVSHTLATQVDLVRIRDPLVREDLPEGVHTMRVAVRRLRSALATCRPFLDRSVTDPLRDELGWLSDALGEARDSEVRFSRLGAAIDALVEERPDLDWDDARVRPALCSPLSDRHDHALTAVAEVLASDRYAALLDRLQALVADPPWTDRADRRVRGAYRRRAERELRRLHRRMRAADDPALTPDERAHALHEARKATKRARYAVEPLRRVYGQPAKKLTKRLKKLQSALGQHQDTVVTRTYLVDVSHTTRPALDPAAALLAGALVERESLDAVRYERRAAKAWQKVARSPSLVR